MDASDIIQLIFFGLLGFGIPVFFWIGALIFGTIMLRRGGGKPERIFITGAAMNILGTVLRILVVYLPTWLSIKYSSIDTIRSVNFIGGLVIDIVGAVGIFCLLYSFWLKFNIHTSDKPVSV
jgi:ABC-type Fe3+-siderophore transport system permease subunit